MLEGGEEEHRGQERQEAARAPNEDLLPKHRNSRETENKQAGEQMNKTHKAERSERENNQTTKMK